MEAQKKDAKKRKEVAEKYFKAFHDGKLDQVYSYLDDDCTVTYGLEKPEPARHFMENSKEMIASLKFQTNAFYTSEDSDNVLIDFSFTVPGDGKTPAKTVNAIDVIEFNKERLITSISVIPNE